MKKVYIVLSALFLILLLAVGVYSIFHLNANAAKPELTFGSLLDGEYSSGRRNWYAEAFPQSESLKSMNKALNGFYNFSALSGKDDVQLIVTADGQIAQGGASLQPDTNSAAQPSGSGDPADGTQPTETTEPNNVEPSDGLQPGMIVEDLGAAMLIGNRAVEVAYAEYDTIDKYSAAVTSIATALGSNVNTYCVLVPNAAEFYTPEAYHTGECSQSGMISYAYGKMGSNVKTVDAYSKLAAHIDEYLYFRTDHHWTQLGAYYAYTAYCEKAGLKAEPLSAFETGQYDVFVGSMYQWLKDYPQAAILYDNPDTLKYYRPHVDLDTTVYSDTTLTNGYPLGTICHVDAEISNKYLCFLGGDHPITVIKTDVDGPVCMLVKESYGNAFAPWLTSHYSKIVVVDPREFNQSGKPTLDIAQFAQEQNVTDCIILDYPMMIGSENYIGHLNRLVK
ncbi:MAG: hypothetical protein IJJ99_04355 [Oscillospiraceae bacterium]|nr:hypothetical protein [Oscillospiraceae bacterium]